jgi:hypothetical protein
MSLITTDRTRMLINYLRDLLLGIQTAPQKTGPVTYFTDHGYTRAQLYRRNAPIKDPQFRYPCLIFSWDPDRREVTTDIDLGVLTIQVYTNTYTDTEDAGNSIADVLHNLTAQVTEPYPLYIFQTHDMGGPAEPWFENDTNTWSTSCSFKMRVG